MLNRYGSWNNFGFQEILVNQNFKPSDIKNGILQLQLNVEVSTFTVDLGNLSQLEHLEHLQIFSEGARNFRETPFRKLRIAENFGNLTNLKYVEILGFNEVIFPESIGNLVNLKQISISGPGQQNGTPGNLILPSQIGKLQNLTRLYIENFTIKKLPKSVTKLKNLRYLNINLCRSFQYLPEDIGKLENLTELRVNFGDLRKIPQSIVELHKLNYALLSNCDNITSMPSEQDIKHMHPRVQLELNNCRKSRHRAERYVNEYNASIIDKFRREYVVPYREKMVLKRMAPKSLKKTLRDLRNRFGKEKTDEILDESTADDLWNKFPKQRETKKFREKKARQNRIKYALNRQKMKELNEQVQKGQTIPFPAFADDVHHDTPPKVETESVESSPSPEFTPEHSSPFQEFMSAIQASPAQAAEAMDVVSDSNSPASTAAAHKRKQSSPESVDWSVGSNDNDNRPQKQSRRQAWKGGKRTKRRSR